MVVFENIISYIVLSRKLLRAKEKNDWKACDEFETKIHQLLSIVSDSELNMINHIRLINTPYGY